MTTLISAPVASWQARTFFSHAVETVRQVDRVNAEAWMPVDFRPLAGLTPRLTLEGVQTPSLSLWHTASHSGFITVPKVQADVISIRFITAGAMRRQDDKGEHIGRPGRAMMVVFDAMRSAEASEEFASISGTVTRTALAAAHLALEGRDSPSPLPHFLPVVDAASEPLQALMQTMQTVFGQLKAGVQSADLVFPLLEEIMVYRLLTSWPRGGPERVQQIVGPSPRPLRRAKDYIDGHLAGKLLLADVAGAAGVGVRRLQLVFKAEVGKTPAQYILDRRLDRVRADLRTPAEEQTPIRTIAARWGFTHMGEFSRRYRVRFGEQPSLTQRTGGPTPATRSR